MKIGIDLDEVIVDYIKGLLEFYNQRFNKNLLYENWKIFNLWDFEPISKEEAVKLMDEFYALDSFDNLSLVEGAKEAIHKLAEDNEISIITARPLRWGKKTRDFFDKHFPEKKINLLHSRAPNDFKIDKAGICKNLRIDLIIDDQGLQALSCAEKGVKAFLFDKPWNKNCEEHENIVRVNNWNEILEKINELNKTK